MRPVWPDPLLARLRAAMTRRNVLIFTAGVVTGVVGWWLFGPDPAIFAVIVVWLAFYIDWLVRR